MSEPKVETSMRGLIASLDIGDTFSRSVRLRAERFTKALIVEQTAMLRNNIASSMRRAKQETGNDYMIETGNFVTNDGAVMIVAAATRMA